eukprot:COSAG01_NODE_283_length_19477_cov_44.267468_20_plen_109_part_00
MRGAVLRGAAVRGAAVRGAALRGHRLHVGTQRRRRRLLSLSGGGDGGVVNTTPPFGFGHADAGEWAPSGTLQTTVAGADVSLAACRQSCCGRLVGAARQARAGATHQI